MSYSAILLAGGSGRRMGGDVKKQYIMLSGRPVISYPLEAFLKSRADEIVLVVSPGDEEYVRSSIVGEMTAGVPVTIVPGGAERYDSVFNGISAASGDYVLIHDGARAFITPEIINRTIDEVTDSGACVVGMPAKDTIKISDESGFVADTPARESLWVIQTPQAFIKKELLAAYEKIRSMPEGFSGITDDAMIMERAGGRRVKLVEGSYDNIKLTTPEDITFAEQILKKR